MSQKANKILTSHADTRPSNQAEKTINQLYEPSIYQQKIKLSNLQGHGIKKKLDSTDYPHKDKINTVCWNKNKKYSDQLIAIDSSGLMNVWVPNKNKVIDSIKASNSTWLTSADVERQDGKITAIGTLDNKILIFEINKENRRGIDPEGKKHKAQLLGHTGAIQTVQFLSQQYLIAGSTDSQVSLWDLNQTSRHLQMNQVHTSEVLCLSVFENDPNIFLSGSSDLTAKIWDIRVKNPVQHTFRGHESAVNTVKFMPFRESTTFATGSDDSCIRLFDLRMIEVVSVFQDQKNFDGVYSICFSNSGRFIFCGTESNKLKAFDVLDEANKYLEEEIFEKDGIIKSIDLSLDGFCLALSGNMEMYIKF
ncbi:hypothetical protein ABPG72_016703 [Tetrahymena utriculariae]